MRGTGLGVCGSSASARVTILGALPGHRPKPAVLMRAAVLRIGAKGGGEVAHWRVADRMAKSHVVGAAPRNIGCAATHAGAAHVRASMLASVLQEWRWRA